MKYLLIILSLVFFNQTVFAKGPCKDDRKKFCQGVERGKGRIARCLFKNWDQLSASCKEKKNHHHQRWSAKQAACGSDITKHCTGTDPGEGRIGKCLREKKNEVSGACKAFLKERRQKNKGKMVNCKDDIKQHCAGVERGGGRIWKCLVEKRDSLSETCKSEWPSLSKMKPTTMTN